MPSQKEDEARRGSGNEVYQLLRPVRRGAGHRRIEPRGARRPLTRSWKPAEKAAYAAQYQKAQTGDALTDLEQQANSAEGGETVVDEAVLEEAAQQEIDYTNFKPQRAAACAGDGVASEIAPATRRSAAELTRYLPELTPDMLESLRDPLLAVTYAYGQDFKQAV